MTIRGFCTAGKHQRWYTPTINEECLRTIIFEVFSKYVSDGQNGRKCTNSTKPVPQPYCHPLFTFGLRTSLPKLHPRCLYRRKDGAANVQNHILLDQAIFLLLLCFTVSIEQVKGRQDAKSTVILSSKLKLYRWRLLESR